jgi:hypothetical protein
MTPEYVVTHPVPNTFSSTDWLDFSHRSPIDAHMISAESQIRVMVPTIPMIASEKSDDSESLSGFSVMIV